MRVGARRSSPRVLFNGNANPGGCNEGRVEGERSPECGCGPRRRTHYALGLALGMEGRSGELRKGAVRPGSVRGDAKPGKLLREGIGVGNGMQRSPVNGYVVSHRTEETAPQREAFGLLLPCDRSKGKLRCRFLCPAATPQSWGSGRSLMSAPTAECRECEAASAAPPVLPKSKSRGSWVASQSLGSPPVSGTAVNSGSAVKRDSWIAVLGPVATSAILVLVVGMPRRE